MKPRPSAFSTLLIYVGMALFLAPFLLLSIAFPRLPIGWALVGGIALGAPVMAWAMHMQSKETHGGQTPPFLPSRGHWGRFGWHAAAGICLLLLLVLPGGILLPWFLSPAGDAMPDAWSRAGALTLLWCIAPVWSRFSANWIRHRFAGRIEPSFAEFLTKPQPSGPPKGVVPMGRYWLELTVVAAGVALTSGMLAIPAGLAVPPVVQRAPGRGRGRSLAILLVWLRDHPNFVLAFTMLVAGKLFVQTLIELGRSRDAGRTEQPKHATTNRI